MKYFCGKLDEFIAVLDRVNEGKMAGLNAEVIKEIALLVKVPEELAQAESEFKRLSAAQKRGAPEALGGVEINEPAGCDFRVALPLSSVS